MVTEAAYAVDSSNNPTGPYVQCVAVSTSPDATGTWNRYVFQVSTTLYPDHPTVGVWSDGYYLSFNQHTSTGTWAGAGALAMERTKMLAGQSAQARYFDLENVTPGLGGMLPADINGYNAPSANAPELYLQAHDDLINITRPPRALGLPRRLDGAGHRLDVPAPRQHPARHRRLRLSVFILVHRPERPDAFWTACLAGRPTTLGNPAFPLEPLSVVYNDNSDALPQLGGRLQWGRTPGGNETLAATATQDMSGGYATPAWFKLSNIGGAGWGIGSRGIYDPLDNTSRYLPSAAFDNSGNIALGYVKTDASTYLTTAYTNAATPRRARPRSTRAPFHGRRAPPSVVERRSRSIRSICARSGSPAPLPDSGGHSRVDR